MEYCRVSFRLKPAEVKSLTDVVSSAPNVATETPISSADGVDADWEFCKFL